LTILIVACFYSLKSRQNEVEAAPPSEPQALGLVKQSNGPRIEIKPSMPLVMFEAQAVSNKVLTCKALGDKPGMFSQLRWSGPDRTDNWDELAKRHKVKESTRNGLSVELEFKNPTSDDSGEYYCHGVYQSSDVYNASIKVRVYNPIKLENCPERQYVIEDAGGQKITCRITGDSPSVVFLKDGTPIDQFGSRYKGDNDDGLEINGPVNKDDAGTYTVEITADITGDRKVFNIYVEVRSKPEIVPYDPSTAAKNSMISSEYFGIEGEQKELKCEVKGNPRPLVLWYDPRRRNLTHIGGYHVNPESGTLLISKVSMEFDNGDFECFAYNSVGEAKRTVSMAVLQRPAITTFENKSVEEGQEAILECRATGSPRPSFSIRKHGLNVMPYKVGDDHVREILELEEGGGVRSYIYRVRFLASRSHYGLHYCNATNMAGSAERVGQLLVKHKPDLSQTPPEQYVRQGKNITVTCHIRANPAPKVSWFAGNNQILNIESSNFKSSPDGQTHIVTMMPPPGYQGSNVNFRCHAMNELGEAEQIIVPRYTSHPGMVNVVVQESTPTTAKLLLSVSNDGGDRVRGYRYRAYGSTLDPFNPFGRFVPDNQNETYIDAAPAVSTYTIRNLYPYYRYRISIRAFNDVGEGDITEFQVETRKPTRPDPPIIIKPAISYSTQSVPGIVSDYQNAYLLKWTPPELDNGGPIQRYIIRINRVNRDTPDLVIDEGEERIIEHSNERPLNARLGPLEVNQHYRIQLRAKNDYGESEPAQVVVYTSRDRPSMSEFGSNVMAWLAEPPTSVLVVLIVCASLFLVLVDAVFCFYCQIGVMYYLKNCCCPGKPNSVISEKTYA